MAIRQIKNGKAEGPDNIPTEVRHRGYCKGVPCSTQEYLEGRTSVDRLERRILHQYIKKRSKQILELPRHHTTIGTKKRFQLSVTELDERFSRRLASRSTGRIL
ncbi:unnamed protein product [Schistosoma mattheei]|uniref:Uncharacterized protein n=1 Tax=Schistosoma mattheei TaxID=31246 RepID=A0A183PA44_9TREM|nr:unnamed protein product [Schistosoma mattheei]